MITIKNISGNLSIYNFRVTITDVSVNAKEVVINYKGIANPSLSNVLLSNYQYSINGSQWNTMTPSNDTELSGLSFVPEGTDLVFKWVLPNRDIYNVDIFIRIRALYDTMYTLFASRQIYISKKITELTKVSTIELPEDYGGIDGAQLLKRAPKLYIE